METPDAEAAVDEEWKDVIKKAHITEGKSNIPEMFERAISSVETILCLMNLYMEIFLNENWFDH